MAECAITGREVKSGNYIRVRDDNEAFFISLDADIDRVNSLEFEGEKVKIGWNHVHLGRVSTMVKPDAVPAIFTRIRNLVFGGVELVRPGEEG